MRPPGEGEPGAPDKAAVAAARQGGRPMEPAASGDVPTPPHGTEMGPVLPVVEDDGYEPLRSEPRAPLPPAPRPEVRPAPPRAQEPQKAISYREYLEKTGQGQKGKKEKPWWRRNPFK